MKNLFIPILLTFSLYANAQIGIGTTSPNSTLDVRGALSLNYRAFTGTTTSISSTDNTVIFTGTLASTATLPDATTCTGRMYRIKNASTTSPTPVLTIATTSAQTIDGSASWSLDEPYETVVLVSNGSNWYISSQSLPASGGGNWAQGGNSLASIKNLGTKTNYDLPFITNNTEKMRLTSGGSLGIGTSTFNGTYPERLLVDAGSTGNTNYQNVIVGKGNTNSYAQLNIQNTNAGTGASSDVVATADNGNETTNYVDLGINGSGNTSTGVLGGANTAYLYSTGGDFAIGNSVAAKNLLFFTAGTSSSNERMRIDASGNVGIGTTSPTAALHVVKSNTGANVVTIQNTSVSGYSSVDFLNNSGTLSGTFGYANGSTGAPFTGRTYFNSYGNDFLLANNSTAAFLIDGPTSNVGVNNVNPSEKLDVTGNIRFSGALMPNNAAGTSGYVLQSNGSGSSPTWVDPGGSGWQLNGNNVSAIKNLGTTSNYDLPFITNNTEKMRLTSSGSLGIGTSTFNGTYPERLLVDAGSTGNTNYQNVIVGKGNTNSYAQLNIQNTNAGTGASSDVVATADNGNETTNYIDMGINGSGNTSTGVIGGANTAYLYSVANDFAFGNSTANKNLLFFTGGTASGNERMRITGGGLVGIGNITPVSTLEVNGSVGYAITTTSTTITLDATNYTVIITGGTPTINLPAAAAGNSRRIYVIVNRTASPVTTSSYLNFSGSSTSVVANSSITVQSNGTNWYRIQ